MQILSQLSRPGRPDPVAERRPSSEPGSVDKFIYQAFISYSHAVDRKLAPALQARLRRFARPWYRWRGRSIFRDETGLALTEGLWPTISAALDGSKTFILLASPEAAESVWVGREVAHWLSLRTASSRLRSALTGRASSLAGSKARRRSGTWRAAAPSARNSFTSASSGVWPSALTESVW